MAYTTPVDPVEELGNDRVREHTDPEVLQELDDAARSRVEAPRTAPRTALDARIEQLDGESDIERALEINAATIGLTGLALGAFVHRRWLALPAVVLGFLLQHGVQGWCPPLPLFRRAGLRTRREIDAERYALKALRGDFDAIGRR